MTRGVVFGTAGHVDHGKTALVRALTGVETDRWVEERERGLTIDIGFARLDAGPDLDAGIVDVPGHEDFVKNMLAGSTGIDVLLLVVAADEGPMPQTREHLMIARLLGVRCGLVALNKVDRVEADWLELVREATRDELSRMLGHTDWPIVDVSAATGVGLGDLREQIRVAADRAPERDGLDVFRMPVDRSFSVRGAGTVVTGTTWSGSVSTGDRVRLLPANVTTRVRALQVHGVEREEVGPARRCAMALVGVKASQADRGSVVVGEGNWKALRRFGARIEVPAASSREVDHGQRVRLFLGTAEVMARVRTEDRGLVRRGETTWVVLDCEQPVVARVGDRFILRFYSPVTTIAGGQVSELEPPRGWRERLGAWNEILTGDPEQSIIAAVNASGGLGLDSGDVPLASTAPGSRAESMLEANPDVSRIGNAWYGRMAMEDAAAAVVNQLERAHEIRRRASAESLESVRASISVRYSVPLIDFAIESLTSTGAVVLRGPTIRLPGHEAELDAAEEAASRELVQILSAAGLAPPSPSEMTARIGVEREVLNDLLRLLVEREEIVSITPEMIVTRETEETARRVVRMIAGQGNPASPGDFREALGVTRKYLIPLLEYMDRIGVTLRTSEGRIARDS